MPLKLRVFRAPDEPTSDGSGIQAQDSDDPYGDKPISDDFISDIYLDFDKRTRAIESQEYLRTLFGMF